MATVTDTRELRAGSAMGQHWCGAVWDGERGNSLLGFLSGMLGAPEEAAVVGELGRTWLRCDVAHGMPRKG